MVKALKRRVGAHAVTIDTLEEIASYSLLDPRKINFKELDTACESAHYKLAEVRLEAWGEVVQVAGKEGKYLKIRGTGQLIRISGDLPLGKVNGLVGKMVERSSPTPMFKPVKAVGDGASGAP